MTHNNLVNSTKCSLLMLDLFLHYINTNRNDNIGKFLQGNNKLHGVETTMVEALPLMTNTASQRDTAKIQP